MKKTVRCATYFNRKHLKKIKMLQITEDIFCIRTLILNRDTLGTSYLKSYLKKESVKAIIVLYLQYFLETDTLELD